MNLYGRIVEQEEGEEDEERPSTQVYDRVRERTKASWVHCCVQIANLLTHLGLCQVVLVTIEGQDKDYWSYVEDKDGQPGPNEVFLVIVAFPVADSDDSSSRYLRLQRSLHDISYYGVVEDLSLYPGIEILGSWNANAYLNQVDERYYQHKHQTKHHKDAKIINQTVRAKSISKGIISVRK